MFDSFEGAHVGFGFWWRLAGSLGEIWEGRSKGMVGNGLKFWENILDLSNTGNM